ncbi:hypothetical protein [uncultured Ruminobacter sp.]|nr:hypothetical protein [uncultured Ruminobacter sp.]
MGAFRKFGTDCGSALTADLIFFCSQFLIHDGSVFPSESDILSNP